MEKKDIIPFNKPCFTGAEPKFVQEAVQNGIISGAGKFTHLVREFFSDRFGGATVFLTTSCTAALEMSALLCEFQPGDEVILPSFTHVSTANAFYKAGATLRFADSRPEHPNISVSEIERLINSRTRAIVPVHYAGVACEMDEIRALADAHSLIVIEDAAHAIGAELNGKPLGTFGDMATFSFHETKNITSGKGGMLVLNEEKWVERAWKIYEYGTNRNDFRRGKTEKYSWVDVGSSFGISELNAAWLWGQLQDFDAIAARRRGLWETYFEQLAALRNSHFELPWLPEFPEHNGHIFQLLTENLEARESLLAHLEMAGVNAVFHYITLHDSPFFRDKYEGPQLENAIMFSQNLLRLPLFDSLTSAELDRVVAALADWKGY